MDLRERSDGVASRHPWELARRDFLLALLREHRALQSARAILDVGSGDAWLIRQVTAAAGRPLDVVGWDANYGPDDLQDLAGGGVRLTAARPDERFDLVLLMDVLEHVDDDHTFLRDIADGSLADDGLVVLTVPAWPALFSRHDELLQHRRRYTPRAAKALVQRAGLDVIVSGGVFHGLLAPRCASVLLERALRNRSGARDDDGVGIGAWRGGKATTGAIAQALAWETRLSLALARRGVEVPGLSFFAVCRRAG